MKTKKFLTNLIGKAKALPRGKRVAIMLGIGIAIIGGIWFSYPKKADKLALRKEPRKMLTLPGRDYTKERTPYLVSKYAINTARQKAGLPPIGDVPKPQREKNVLELFDKDGNKRIEGDEIKQVIEYLKDKSEMKAEGEIKAKKAKEEMEKLLSPEKKTQTNSIPPRVN